MARAIDDIISLDPQESFESGGGEIIGNVYDTLVEPDARDAAKLNGILAERWETSADGLTTTFLLRDGPTFASGNKVRADDVVFSLRRAVTMNKSPAFIVNQFGFNPGNAEATITAPDARTVVLRVRDAVAPSFLLNCLSAAVASVVERDAAMAHAEGGDLGNSWLKKNSAGSGAWAVRSWRASESVSLDRNPHAATTSRIKRLVILHRPDPAAQLLALRAGDVDIARNLGAEQLAAIKSSPELAIVRHPRAAITYVAMNQSMPELAHPQVRQAIKWAIDTDAIVSAIAPGLYDVHQSFLPSGFAAALDDAPFHKDTARAKKLLAEAGLADGFAVTLDHRNSGPIVDIAQAIQADLGAAGIRVSLRAAEARQVFTAVRARSYQLAILGWGSDYEDANSNADTFCVDDDDSDAARNRTVAWQAHWSDADISKRAQAAVRERDADKRTELYKQLQRDHRERSPFAILLQTAETAVVRKGVTGFEIGAISNLIRWRGLDRA